jgi:N-acetylneuraminate lyase
MNKHFSGVLSALITPYTEHGEVNFTELKRLVRYEINKGIDGFYVGGSTGEAFLLTQNERKKILEAVVEENNGEKLVLSHVGQISTSFAIDLAQHAKSVGVDAISAISPFYYNFSVNEIKNYYFDIMNHCDMPMFIYNFPAFSGFTLTNDILQDFCQNPNVIGVKYTSNDLYQMERMKTLNPNLVIWNGYDEILLSGLVAGADGGIGSTYNCMCQLIRRIYDNYRKGNMEAARASQQIANHVINIMIKNGVIASVKTLLEFDGFSFGGCRKPFADMTEIGRKELFEVYQKYLCNY